MTITEFFHMGGYAFYVWVSYGLTFLILLANFVIPRHSERTFLRTLARKLRRQQRDRLEKTT